MVQAIKWGINLPTKSYATKRIRHTSHCWRSLQETPAPLLKLRDPHTDVLHTDLPTVDQLSSEFRDFALAPPPHLSPDADGAVA